MFLGKGHGFIHILPYLGKALEIAINKALRLGARDPQVAGKTKAGNAINHPEINRFGAAANIRSHLIHRHAEHLGRSHCMNIVPLAERRFERINPGHMSQDA